MVKTKSTCQCRVHGFDPWSRKIPHPLEQLLILLSRDPDSSVGKEYTCNAGDPGLIPGSGRSAWEGIGYPLQYSWASPDSPAGKESTCNVGDLGLIPGLGRSAGEGKGYPLQYSGLENSINCIVHGVAKSWTQLSEFHFLFYTSYPVADTLLLS